MPPEVMTPFVIALAVFGVALTVPQVRRRLESQPDLRGWAARGGRIPRRWVSALAASATSRRLASSARPVGLVALLCLVVGAAVAAWPTEPSGDGDGLAAEVRPVPSSLPSLTPSTLEVTADPLGAPDPDGQATGDGLRRSRSTRARDGSAGPGGVTVDAGGGRSGGGVSGGTGGTGGGGGGTAGGGGGGGPAPSPGPSPSPTASPTTDPSPSPSPEPTSEPTPEPSASEEPCVRPGNNPRPCEG